MKKISIFFVLALEASAVWAEKSTQVYLDNGELNYVGEVSQAGNKELFELFETLERKPEILSIRSKGGNTDSGIALGTWVHEQGITIKVLEYCFSSCANYVFTAASRKIVSNFAVVGYHGGLSSSHFGVDEEQEAKFAAIPAVERAAARKIFIDSFKEVLAAKEKEEEKFFALVKVNQKITTLGQSKKYSERYKNDDRFLGWTFSVDGFKKLGVSNIRVVNPPWQPKFIKSDFSVFLVDVK